MTFVPATGISARVHDQPDPSGSLGQRVPVLPRERLSGPLAKSGWRPRPLLTTVGQALNNSNGREKHE